MKLTAVLVLAACASAQSYSSHSGWNFTDTLESAADVLVADITAGSAVDSGSQVTVKATLHTVRILSGGIAPESDLHLQWNYRPAAYEPPAVTTKVPLVRGLWFLRRNAEGALEPLQAGFLTPVGGSFLPLGSTAPVYAETEPLQTRIAREIDAAMEDLVAQHAPDFAPHRPEATLSGVLPAWVQTRNTFQALQIALQSLNEPAALEVYRRFSGMPDLNLEAVGIFGRLRAGDASAVFDLERDLPYIVATFDALHPAPPILMGLDLSKDLPAAHALARIALSETPLPGIEGGLAFALARTRRPEFLPYFMVMLDSPDPGVRDSVLMSFCQLLGPPPGTPGLAGTAFWSPAMSASCPNHSPLNDAELEHRDIQFWKEWWIMHRDDVARAVTLPEVFAPARYGVPQRSGFQPIREVPMEVRFESLIRMADASAPAHYHASDGSIVNGPPPGPHDPVSQLLKPADREIFLQVIESVHAKLIDIQASAQRLQDAARIAGTPPDLQQSRALNTGRQSALKTGLDDLKAKLSPQGWQTVEQFLKSMGIGVFQFTPQ